MDKYDFNKFSDILDGYTVVVARIETADYELVKAVLTHYVRGERFCDGTWAEAAIEGIFLALLKRLSVLTQGVETDT